MDRALTANPGNPALEALKAAIIAESDPELDLWPKAVGRLDDLLGRHPESPAVRWNLARLLDERGRTAAAEPHWAWLRARAPELPAPYAAALCGAGGGSSAAQGCARPSPAAIPFPWPLPYTPGADLDADRALDAELRGEAWQQLPFDLGGKRMHGAIHRRPGLAVLVLDRHLDLIALTGSRLGSADDLRRRAGAPQAVRPVPGAEVWTYGPWGALIRDGQVAEAWAGKG